MSAALAPLPIDDVLPQLVAAVRERGTCVLVAPPGAGKTTRVPGALLDAGVVRGSIVVLQPRRIAARMAAARIASERGGELGGEVGYQVRFDRKISSATRIELVTEGILTRRLLGDPELRGVGAVVIDEFHERHLDGDLALALVARLRERRPELAIVVMSATLDAEPVAAFVGSADSPAPIVRSLGRAFPIEIEHVDRPDDRPLGKQIAGAVRRELQRGADSRGDILVFLPGAGEIRRAAEDLEDAARTFELEVVALHGDLTADEQDRAVRRSSKRKVILATNVAETSVTIDGVTCVIDSGLARIARHSPWSGLPSLEIEPVSQASCTQRAGRAGRTRPGRVVRLYTKHDFDGRRAFEQPEIQRADLSGVALELYGAGVAGLAALRWYDPPSPTAATAADELLVRLGALTANTPRAITPLGRRMLRFAIHPRASRLVCEAEARGVAREACVVAALLGARELRLERRGRATAKLASQSDVIDDLDALLAARDRGQLRIDRLRRDGLDIGTAQYVDRAARQLERDADLGTRPPADVDATDRELMIAILAAYPDRVGKRRAQRSAEVVLAGGGSGALAPSSAVIDAELLVAVDVAQTGARGQASKVQIRRASAIEAAWLLDLFLDRIVERDELEWSAAKQRVERVVQMTYDGLVIDEQRDVEGARRAGAAASALLARQAIAAGIEKFVDREALDRWRARIAFVAQLGDKRALIERLAPTHLALPRRQRVAIHYELDRPPWLASRMQDFFGLARAPAVGDGRVPLVLHLLAPNQRPVQVTTDLPGFWVKHYPALRKQLMRRYPRHAWPEDPTQLIDER